VWLSRIAKTNAEQAECEQNCHDSGKRPGRGARVLRSNQTGKQRIETTNGDQCDDGQYDRRGKHEQALDTICHAHGPETTKQSVSEDDAGADQNTGMY